MIYVYAKYQKPTHYIKRDIANVKVFTMLAGFLKWPITMTEISEPGNYRSGG